MESQASPVPSELRWRHAKGSGPHVPGGVLSIDRFLLSHTFALSLAQSRFLTVCCVVQISHRLMFFSALASWLGYGSLDRLDGLVS